MKMRISNQAGFSLVEAMVVVAVVGLMAIIGVRHVGGINQQWALANMELLARLKLAWLAVSIASTLAALTFAWPLHKHIPVRIWKSLRGDARSA